MTLLVALDQTVPALVPLFADAPREVFGAHQAIETAAWKMKKKEKKITNRKKTGHTKTGFFFFFVIVRVRTTRFCNVSCDRKLAEIMPLPCNAFPVRCSRRHHIKKVFFRLFFTSSTNTARFRISPDPTKRIASSISWRKRVFPTALLVQPYSPCSLFLVSNSNTIGPLQNAVN